MVVAIARRAFGPGSALASLNAVATGPVAILLRKTWRRQRLHRWNRRRRVIRLRVFSWFRDW
jgi:hypothetical protein